MTSQSRYDLVKQIVQNQPAFRHFLRESSGSMLSDIENGRFAPQSQLFSG